MAASEVVLEVLPQAPPQEPAAALLPHLAVPKVLQYLYLASAWVGCAAVAAGTAARRALGDDSPVTYAFLKVSIGALLFPVLLVLVVTLRLLRAMCAAGFALSVRTVAREVQIHSRKMFGALTWKLLLEPAALVLLVSFLFFLLLGAGALVLGGLLPVHESQRERIGSALFDTGVLGAMGMSCFVIIPSFALKVWRSE
ncbi:uncharacterized protein LOC120712359 [Panicum virgatum]|uniref:Uncharacterized protein n=1 Tax=Panicum virgatum TaxID=38727 RepID=A0A8T0RDH1_PANVG|nr:uncharacterized protein LOC120712359 [Panicum virgatum]KAG2583910.1 hypothetical protein PVAP13_6KG251600 [Panicum virgatum]KAG2583911.1 hypothetical protein PVAP13_6KG251600 [Panicum virgatum]